MGAQCRDSEFQEIRFVSGSRQGEVYMDIRGWGKRDQWYTIYEFSTALNLLLKEIPET